MNKKTKKKLPRNFGKMKDGTRVRVVKAYICDIKNLEREGAMTIHSMKFDPAMFDYIPCEIHYKI